MAAILRFDERMCFRTDSCFPENQQIEWKLFQTKALSNTAVLDSREKEIVELFSRYRHFLQDTNETCEELVRQNRAFRFIISENFKSWLIKTFDDVARFGLNDEQFIMLSRLLDVCATFQASNADCERCFSLMNVIKAKSQNRLETNHLDMMMMINSYYGSVFELNIDSVYQLCSSQKDRRKKI
ncbi:hypothetical protein CHS0354_005531 [Potamilus streckersoni]|uniref:HAT C-terminal dimerisation domain-containing protein n=1 Tax=Potamilus streckersoni TaxID=2493646 RepID=A0AAE0SAR5_9BIVA|nr:hypothetical protein CHS0354_005531 [Potamilus streckersoni]